MKKQYSHLALFFLLCIFAACSDNKNDDIPEPDPAPDPTPTMTYHVEGYAELGAFIHNSTITVFPLDKSLAHIEKFQYSNEAKTDYGLFSVVDNMSLNESLYFEVQVTGNFFNGTKGRYSEHKTTLRAINHLENHNSEKRSINRYIKLPATNVNIFTQLTAARICNLLKKNPDYDKMIPTSLEIYKKASEQALKEMFTAFSISDIYVSMLSVVPTQTSFSQYNDPSSIMAAVSNILLTSVDEEFLDDFFKEWDKDFASDGRIDNEDIKESIRYGQQNMKYSSIHEQLDSFYKAYNFKNDFPEFWRFVDRNGDGRLDEQDKPDDFEITEVGFTPSRQQCIQLLEQVNKYLRDFLQTECVWEANFCGVIGPIPDYPTTLVPDDNEVYEIWTAAYATIRQCNYMIHVLTSKAYGYEVEPYVGTAYAIQSLVYQSLTQLFGDVPYVTPDNFNDINHESDLTRTPVKLIYAKQLEALEKYANSLPQTATQSQPESNPVSFAAAQLLMATMYAEIKDYGNASKHFEKIDDNTYLSANLWKVNNNKSSMLNKPLYRMYFNGPYHLIYRIANQNALRVELLLANNQVAEASNALKIFDGNWEGSDKADEIKAHLLDKGINIMGQTFGCFSFLKRLGAAKEFLKIEDYQLLLPIPSKVAETPNITPNPGY